MVRINTDLLSINSTSAAPAQFPESSKTPTQSPSSAGTLSIVACPKITAENAVGEWLKKSGC